MRRWLSKPLPLRQLAAHEETSMIGPYVIHIRQNGNNVSCIYYVPDHQLFNEIQTRWDMISAPTSNEHQQTWSLGSVSTYELVLESVQYGQPYVFKVQGKANDWSPWSHANFTTRDGSYFGPLWP
jgi:hypothetical protein